MCLWCETGESFYRAYRDEERRALREIRRMEEKCPPGGDGAERCPERDGCLWEKKLAFVMARFRRERLAVAMRNNGTCDPEEPGRPRRHSRHSIPPPTLSPHLLVAFERYVDRMFDRLTRGKDPVPAPGRRDARPAVFRKTAGPPR